MPAQRAKCRTGAQQRIVLDQRQKLDLRQTCNSATAPAPSRSRASDKA
jgi:hypothetical protein